MNKEDHIKYWVTTSKRDWLTVMNMFDSKDYVPSLFFAHLHIEKLCKALWVKNNAGNIPPKIHNLVKILSEANIKYSQEQLDFMLVMNTFQLEGRYPDYRQNLFRAYKRERTNEILKQGKQFSKWLQEQL